MGDVRGVRWSVRLHVPSQVGFPGGSDSEESAAMQETWVSILGSGRSAGRGNGYARQYSCLENSIDRGAWQATVHGVAESDATNTFTFHPLKN